MGISTINSGWAPYNEQQGVMTDISAPCNTFYTSLLTRHEHSQWTKYFFKFYGTSESDMSFPFLYALYMKKLEAKS